ncbi:hypothetical protein [Winogradskyella luteola]|uniref:Uncharacterized protein n=1 Tax=Winogradskyella luteola TaxID=2828330 RepID=A0A9X1FA41_9FLAO|nr:hypothetical protein [Winogradskyella luteola]MBV7269954.1 hypothetical protein [Winogradskyella luteola]
MACQKEEQFITDESQDSIVKKSKDLEDIVIDQSNLCDFNIESDITPYFGEDGEPLVDFRWYNSDEVFEFCSVPNIPAYIQVSDNPPFASCGYSFINEYYPIDFYNTDHLTKNINYLTDGPPHLVYNPYNPPTFQNEIYGSKCFYWRIIVISDCSNSCQNIITKWKFFEFNI